MRQIRRASRRRRRKLDRLGRSLPHLIETVNGLEARGVSFRSLTEAIDTTTPGGRLIFHIFGALGQFERDLIRERTRAGLDAAMARGRRGWPKTVMTDEKPGALKRLSPRVLRFAKLRLASKSARQRSTPRSRAGPAGGRRRIFGTSAEWSDRCHAGLRTIVAPDAPGAISVGFSVFHASILVLLCYTS